jgi:hypothetical protein
MIVSQSKLAMLQQRARGVEADQEQAIRAGRHDRATDYGLLLTGLYEQIEALDQQIAAYWRDRAWGSR